ncbi:MAG: type II toxin-antitoxin system RelE/ParE family toxin [Candidatus Micrarchaeota archaeon]|nr:type II toxin-antitoxin system RelE/ParE family toxin [Candidatus Micrarchaeota archaeon]
MEAYEPVVLGRFSRGLERLAKPVRMAADKKMKKIMENPLRSKPLSGLPGVFSERFLQYRIIYTIEENSVIFVMVGKRDTVYSELRKMI